MCAELNKINAAKYPISRLCYTPPPKIPQAEFYT